MPIDSRPHEHHTDQDRPGEDGHGLRVARDDLRASPLLIALAFGGLWGALGYAILWEGVPFEVHRPFVQSARGTIVLLPARAVLWAIHAAEGVAGRPFELSSTHGWIGVTAAALGAAAAGASWVIGRRIVRRAGALRRRRQPSL